MQACPVEVCQNGHMKSSAFKACVALAVGLSCSKSFTAETNPPAHEWPAANPAAVDQWRSLRFGMFIHWGPVSLTGHEIGWSRGAETPIEVYDNLYRQFNPTNFNADEWVGIAKAAGIATAKTTCRFSKYMQAVKMGIKYMGQK